MLRVVDPSFGQVHTALAEESHGRDPKRATGYKCSSRPAEGQRSAS